MNRRLGDVVAGMRAGIARLFVKREHRMQQPEKVDVDYFMMVARLIFLNLGLILWSLGAELILTGSA